MKSKRDENERDEGDDNVDWEEAPVAGKCHYLTICVQFPLDVWFEFSTSFLSRTMKMACWLIVCVCVFKLSYLKVHV